MRIEHGIRSLRHVRNIGVKDKRADFVYDKNLLPVEIALFCSVSELACWNVPEENRQDYFDNYGNMKRLAIQVPTTPTHEVESMIVTTITESVE